MPPARCGSTASAFSPATRWHSRYRPTTLRADASASATRTRSRPHQRRALGPTESAKRISSVDQHVSDPLKQAAQEWTPERIAKLGTQDIKRLRDNAERLKQAAIVERCNDALRNAAPNSRAGSKARPRVKPHRLVPRRRARLPKERPARASSHTAWSRAAAPSRLAAYGSTTRAGAGADCASPTAA